ncbi:MAG: hypothetical protein J6Z80_00410, partial [Clostridia bacterium]|nr:hypothetical protein [Clostridia bacterium]
MKVIGFGEIIWDVYPEESVIGGAMLNFCSHMAHLGDTVCLLSAIGQDGLGKAALDELKRHGVMTGFVQKNKKDTGRCIVTLDENKKPTFNVLTDTSYDNIRADVPVIEKIRGFGADLFVFNTLIQRSPVSRKALKTILDKVSFPEIFCDINIRQGCYDRESLLLCMEKATVVKISDDEGHFLLDLGIIEPYDPADLPRAVAEKFRNIRAVIYTRGAEGSEVFDAKSGETFRSGRPEQV